MTIRLMIQEEFLLFWLNGYVVPHAMNQWLIAE